MDENPRFSQNFSSPEMPPNPLTVKGPYTPPNSPPSDSPGPPPNFHNLQPADRRRVYPFTDSESDDEPSPRKMFYIKGITALEVNDVVIGFDGAGPVPVQHCDLPDLPIIPFIPGWHLLYVESKIFLTGHFYIWVQNHWYDGIAPPVERYALPEVPFIPTVFGWHIRWMAEYFCYEWHATIRKLSTDNDNGPLLQIIDHIVQDESTDDDESSDNASEDDYEDSCDSGFDEPEEL